MAAIRVVLDTNVLVAAAYNPDSASCGVVEACLSGELTAVLSPSLRREHEFVLARAVRQQPYLERLRLLLEKAEVVEPTEIPRVVPDDPDDDKLVAAALAAGATLISNDTHFLAVTGYQGLRVSGRRSCSPFDARPNSKSRTSILPRSLRLLPGPGAGHDEVHQLPTAEEASQ